MLQEELRAQRFNAKMTQKELSKRLNVSVGMIRSWEHGSRKPSIDELIMLTRIFPVSADELIFGDRAECRDKAECRSWPIHCRSYRCKHAENEKQCCYFCGLKDRCRNACKNNPFKCGCVEEAQR